MLSTHDTGATRVYQQCPGDASWNTPQNWDLGGSPASTFPDNGASALIPAQSPQMSTPILLSNLTMSGSGGINLAGQTLTVNGTTSYSATGGLLNGTVETATAILSSLALDDVDDLAKHHVEWRDSDGEQFPF